MLAEDFVFRFQPLDIQSGAPDSIMRGEMLTALLHFFLTGVAGDNPAASQIKLDLTLSTALEDTLPAHVGWRGYRLATRLSAGFPNGNSLEVSSPIELYFRRVPSGSERWRLAEWKDIAGAGLMGRREAEPERVTDARGTTWGQLFNLFR